MKPIKRVIYDNYDLYNNYADDAKENLAEDGIENPSDDELWDLINFLDSCDWEEVKEDLDNFFSEGTWIMTGTVGRWNGIYDSGIMFTDFDSAFSMATKDCDYISLYDENGHLYLTCSHHDGDNMFEIKRLTEKGEKYFENWEYNYNDTRSEKYIHKQLMEKYSVLPHFVHKMYGGRKTEYEKETA